MPWNCGVSKRVLEKDFVATDILVGVTVIFVVCSFSFLPNFLHSPVFWREGQWWQLGGWSGGKANSGLKSFLYSRLLTAVRIVGRTDLWCVAGCCLVK